MRSGGYCFRCCRSGRRCAGSSRGCALLCGAADQQAPALTKITGGKQDAAADAKIDVAVKNMIAKSFVTNPSKLDAYLNKPSASTLGKDPLVKVLQRSAKFRIGKAHHIMAAVIT